MLQKQLWSSLQALRAKSAGFLTLLVITVIAFTTATAICQKNQPPNCLGGTLDAPIRLDVFSDFQCSWCKLFYQETIVQVLKSYSPSDKVCVIWHEFPLEMHAYGRTAARYSVAAQRLGRKQWLAVIDALYSKQEQWAMDGNIDTVIKDVLSADEFERIKKSLQDPSIDDSITNDITLGQKKGVNGTPSIFLTALNKEHPKLQYAPYAVWKDYFDSIVK